MTKKETFAYIRDNFVAENEELVNFLNHEIELLSKKSSGSRKPTKVQVENEGFKANIVDALAEVNEPITISGLYEVCPPIAGLSNQRVTHMLTALRKEGKVARTYVKKVAYFALGNEGEEA